MVEYYPGTEEPIPDGKYVVYFKQHPTCAPMRKRDEVMMEETYHLEFLMSDTKGFKFEEGFFKVLPYNKTDPVQYYALHNITYIEIHKNSPEVMEAFDVYNGRVVIDDDGRRHYV